MLSKRLIFYILGFCLLAVFFSKDIFADWTYDTTAPSCTISFIPNSPAIIGNPIEVKVESLDTDLTFLSLFIDAVQDQAGKKLVADKSTVPVSPLVYSGWSPASPDTYNFSATARDLSGNENSACDTKPYEIRSAASAWIQVTGDVHSNSRIYVGGP